MYIQAFGVGNGLGAALGGFLCDHFGWRAAFYLQLPFIFIYGFLAFLSCPDDLGPNLAKTQGKTIREAFQTFDSLGAVTLTVTVTCLILGVNLGGNIFPWTHPVVVSGLVLAAIGAVSLAIIERKAVLPILPLKLLSTAPHGNLMWANFSGAIATNTILFNVPLYLQAVRQTSPTTSGLFLVSPLLGVSITAVIVGFYITATRKMKPPMNLGTVCILLGIILATCLRVDTPMWAVPLLIPFCSIGQGMFFPSSTIALLALNAQDEQAVVTTTLGLLRNLGAIMGVAISSWVLQNALLVYLYRTVTAPDEATKEEIIRTVRESIRSIATLDPLHKGQVIDAYAKSLRLTFAAAIVFTLFSIFVVWPTSVPMLQGQHEANGQDTSVFAPEDNESVLYDDDEEAEDDEDEAGETSLGDPGSLPVISRTTTHRSIRTAGSTARATFPDELERRPSFTLSFSL